MTGGSSPLPGEGRAFRLVRQDPAVPVDASQWSATVLAVRQLLREGLELPAGLTVLVGENGSGTLSFTASLGLAALLHDLAREGSQAIVATHSPIIAAVPGADTACCQARLDRLRCGRLRKSWPGCRSTRVRS